MEQRRSARIIVCTAIGIVSLLAVVTFACATPPAVFPTQTPMAAPAVLAEREWTVISEDLNAEFATPDLGPGTQRVAFVLFDDDGLIRVPAVRVRSYSYSGGFDASLRTGVVETVSAHFFEFPLGTRGVHVTDLGFSTPGNWSIEVDVPRPDGTVSTAEIRFKVNSQTKSVAVGQPSPRSKTRTLLDVPSIADLTTGSHRDPQLYHVSLGDAVSSGKPTVVVFASPAFCTNAVCGPQVEVLSEIGAKYGAKANYVHVDLYENPQEIQGDLSIARPSPLLAEWGLTSQEWTFVIGGDGLIAARFENFAPRDEIEAALESALAS